ncbi:MAG: bacillithiol biosynthesis BshC, partial [Bacteroidota bacterium]
MLAITRMKVHQIAFSNIPQFSQKDTDYATGHPKLKPFFKYDATLEAFQQVIEDKKKDPTNRDLLVDVLKEQYSGRPKSKLVNKNINALAHPDTFTVITAHQP